MKKLLLAATAVALCGAAAFAVDNDRNTTRLDVSVGSHVMVSDHGPVIEIRGADGERTVHIERDGSDSRLTINGQDIEVRDGIVRVDGQDIEVSRNSVIIVDGDEIEVIESDDAAFFGPAFSMHMAERAENMARLHIDLEGLEGLGELAGLAELAGLEAALEIDLEEIHADALASMEEAIADIDSGEWDSENSRIEHNGRRWNELTDEEKAEVREELAEAREEMVESMARMRVEMETMRSERGRMREELREAHRERSEALREMRIEIHRERESRDHDHAERDRERAERHAERHAERAARLAERHAERAERHAERAERHAARDARRLARHAERAARHAERRVLLEIARAGWTGDFESADDIRIEEDEDGNTVVWIDGERIETDQALRLGNRRFAFALDGADVDFSDSDGVRIEEDSDGRRRVWVDGEEQTGDDLIEWLNRFETNRLSGGRDSGSDRGNRRVVRIQRDGEPERVIDLSGGRNVWVYRSETDDADDEN